MRVGLRFWIRSISVALSRVRLSLWGRRTFSHGLSQGCCCARNSVGFFCLRRSCCLCAFLAAHVLRFAVRLCVDFARFGGSNARKGVPGVMLLKNRFQIRSCGWLEVGRKQLPRHRFSSLQRGDALTWCFVEAPFASVPVRTKNSSFSGSHLLPTYINFEFRPQNPTT